jgi:aryl-alcohol dehydrogenase-like predicted oxidoreductase
METRRLGREGPLISAVGFGAWQAGGSEWGPNPSESLVIRAIHAGLAAGMTWIDTAEVYGQGASEHLVGRAVARRRDQVLLFSKVAPDEEGTGLRPQEVRRAVRASLRRLGTDHLDLYQVHWPDDRIPIEETWGTMAELVTEGLVRFIGVSNFDRALIERCQAIAPVTSLQNELSMLATDDLWELLHWARESGIGYLAYSPLANGLLTGAITRQTVFSEQDWRSGKLPAQEPGLFAPDALPGALERVDRVRPVADRLGLPLATLALRWVLEQPGVTGVIAGSRNADHTERNAEAGGLRLDRKTLDELDDAIG